MHTIKILSIAFILLGLCLGIARVRGATIAKGAKFFIPVWFIGAAINMYIGVVQAGYSVWEEFPFFLIVFSIPAAVAFAIWLKTKSV